MNFRKAESSGEVDDDGSRNPCATAVADAPPPFAMDTVLNRWGGDAEFVERLITTFLAGAPSRLGEIAQCVLDGDAGGTQRLAHGLKGEAAYCGAEPVRTIAAQMEVLGRAGDLTKASELLKELRVELDRCLTHQLCAGSAVVNPGDVVPRIGK